MQKLLFFLLSGNQVFEWAASNFIEFQTDRIIHSTYIYPHQILLQSKDGQWNMSSAHWKNFVADGVKEKPIVVKILM